MRMALIVKSFNLFLHPYLAPLETKKQEIEQMARAIDSAIIQVESFILKHSD